MLDTVSTTAGRTLSVTDEDAEQRQKIAGFTKDDTVRVIALKDMIQARTDHYVEVFFNHLAKIGAARDLFAKRSVLEQAKQRKREHLLALTGGRCDRGYIEQRIDLAVLYARHGMEPKECIGAYQQLLQAIGSDIVDRFGANGRDAFEKITSVGKVSCLDLSIISDVIIAERERTISLQQQAIRELSTPVLQVRDRLLILPIIGMLDSDRAKRLTSDLLSAIRSSRCKIVVMDITGVAAVDSKVANHIIQTVAAARLMGSAVIITGLTAEVAQALVALGIDLGEIETTADLQSGLERAERILGYRMVRSEDAA
jgi:rsbT co-antagonist protein RsbR